MPLLKYCPQTLSNGRQSFSDRPQLFSDRPQSFSNCPQTLSNETQSLSDRTQYFRYWAQSFPLVPKLQLGNGVWIRKLCFPKLVSKAALFHDALEEAQLQMRLTTAS